MKTNVTNLHTGLDSAEEALSDLEKKLQESMDSTENLNKTLTQVGGTGFIQQHIKAASQALLNIYT